MVDIIKILDGIIEPLDIELENLRQEVLYNKKCDRSWEQSLRRFDEALIKKYQSELIKKKILEGWK